MAWGAKDTSATLLTSIVGTEQFFNVFPQLTPGELIHCEVELDSVGSPTSELRVNVYGTLDDSTENWDDTPLMSFVIANAPDPNKVSFSMSNIYKFRIGVIREGGSDTITSADFSFRRDNVSV